VTDQAPQTFLINIFAIIRERSDESRDHAAEFEQGLEPESANIESGRFKSIPLRPSRVSTTKYCHALFFDGSSSAHRQLLDERQALQGFT
jgi:hypothetical protein